MQQSITKNHLLSFALLTVFFFVPAIAFGQNTFGTDELTGIGLTTRDVRAIVVNLIRISLGLLGVLTLVLIIYAGYLWMTAAGNQDNIDRAKKIIINAVIGLVIILLAAAITEFIFRQINTALTGGSPFNCVPNACTSIPCRACNSTGNGTVFDTTCGSCTLPSDIFSLQQVQTAYETPPGDPTEQVYRCSLIQSVFNHRVEAATAQPPSISLSDGSTVAGSWTTRGKVVQFQPSGLLAASTNHTITYTAGLTDVSGAFLQSCIDPYCSSGPPFSWNFTTGTATDDTVPVITSAYPVLPADSRYETRTVSVVPRFEVNFSEHIDMLSVIDQSGIDDIPLDTVFGLWELDGQGGAPVGGKIDNANFRIEANGNQKGFRVFVQEPYQLKPFTWYRIQVSQVRDLCGNLMSEPIAWDFQTNDSIPGIRQVYPAAGDINACPSTTIGVLFGTSMATEDVWLTFNGSAPAVITPPATSANIPEGIFEIKDAYAPSEENYKWFEFTPSSALIPGQTYTITIEAPNFFVDNDGNYLQQTWSFTVGQANACACAPIITKLEPAQGPLGQCLSIVGRCFQGSNANATVTAVNFNTTQVAPVGVGQQFVTTAVPTSGFGSGDVIQVGVDLTYDTTTGFGTVQSNTKAFLVDSDTSFTGPCLYDVRPDSACYGVGIGLTGDRFGGGGGSSNVVFSNSGVVPSANITSWANQSIDFTLPDTFVDSLVQVSVNGQLSNGLPFDVMCGAGPYFGVTGYGPKCSAACQNTAPYVQFNKAVDPGTVTNSSVVLYACASSDPGCGIATATEVVSSKTVSGNMISILPATGLSQGQYRVVITNTVTDLDGVQLKSINFDDRAYSWAFGVSASSCVLTGVETRPTSVRLTNIGQQRAVTAYALAEECSSVGYINPASYNWQWTSSQPGVADFMSLVDANSDGLIDQQQKIVAASVGETTITASPASSVLSDTTAVTVDLTFRVSHGSPSCSSACPNSILQTVFTSDIDVVSFENAVRVVRCANTGCAAGGTLPNLFSGGTYVSDIATGVFEYIFNAITFDPDTIYRVIVGADTVSTVGARLGGLNYDADGDGEVDSYSWTFTTRNNDCTISRVQVTPGNINFSDTGQKRDIVAKAWSAEGCANDNLIDASGLNWDWNSSAPGIADLMTSTTEPVQIVGSFGVGTAQITAQTGGMSSLATVQVATSGGAGSSCDADPATPQCDPSAMCGNGLQCSAAAGCTCQYPAPTIISVSPSSGFLACLNSTVKVVFSQPMKQPTAAQALISIGSNSPSTNVQHYRIKNGEEGCAWHSGCSVFILFLTGLLPASDNVDVQISATLESEYGVPLTSGYSQFMSTGDSLCSLDGVEIDPAGWFFNTDQAPQNTRDFVALGYSNQGSRVYIQPTPGVYEWLWSWMENDNQNLISTSGTANQQTVTVTNRGQGSAVITATAEVITDTAFAGQHLGRTRSGSAQIDVFICDFPWPDPPPYTDTIESSFGFGLQYCRGNAGSSQLLPNLINIVDFDIPASQPDLLLNRVFKVEGTDGPLGLDTIGLLVFDNPTHASARGWYQSQGFGGNPASVVIDGYDAIVDGRTTYIHFVKVQGNTARSYILALSHTENPSAVTRSVYQRLVDSIQFNSGLNITDKQALQVDLERLGRLGTVARLVNAYYRTNGNTLPDLSANSNQNSCGTFVAGMSTSRWPSWQCALGNILGHTLPVDPVNTIVGCPVDYTDQTACYDVTKSPSHVCGEGSHIFTYENGTLYGNLEYKNITWENIGSTTSDSCRSFSLDATSATFDFEVQERAQ